MRKKTNCNNFTENQKETSGDEKNNTDFTFPRKKLCVGNKKIIKEVRITKF